WEPFCGSLAVLLAKEPCTWEFANDLHGDLVNLARVLQQEDLALALYARAERTLFVEAFSAESRERLLEAWEPGPEPDPERAYHYLRFSWFARNGTAGTPIGKTGTFCVRYSATGGDGARRWRSVVESIPDWHRRLRHVTILGPSDAFKLLPRIDDAPGTVVYADPPYFVKSTRYVHDFAAPDHARLAAELRRFRRARVVLSYYEAPELGELYPGWARIECPVSKSMANAGQRGKKGRTEAPEVLLVNQPDLFTEG